MCVCLSLFFPLFSRPGVGRNTMTSGHTSRSTTAATNRMGSTTLKAKSAAGTSPNTAHNPTQHALSDAQLQAMEAVPTVSTGHHASSGGTDAN